MRFRCGGDETRDVSRWRLRVHNAINDRGPVVMNNSQAARGWNMPHVTFAFTACERIVWYFFARISMQPN